MSSGAKINIFQLIITHTKDEWVMWPLVVLAILMLTICIERLIVIFLDRAKLNPGKFLDVYFDRLKKNNGDKALTVQEMQVYLQKKDSVCAELLKTIFRKYEDGLKKRLSYPELKAWMSEAVEEKADLELPALEVHLGWLAVISNVATLMGLFGTVYGMIGAFYSMASAVGGVKADEMAGGIAIALIATLFGLFVAIPALVLFNAIKNMTEGYVVRLEEASKTVIETLLE
jgi:biopolymer transport protein ExbB